MTTDNPNVPANRPGTNVAGPDYNPFMNYGQQASQRNIVGKLLKFAKGKWRYGDGHADVFPDGTRFVAHMEELLVGWIRWADGQPQEHLMGRVVDGFVPPRRGDLGDTNPVNWEQDEVTLKPRDPWQPGNYLILMAVDGHKIFTLATGSRGGTNAIGELCKNYAKQMRQRQDEFPIVALGTDSYPHKNKAYGRIEVPLLNIVGWAPRSEIDEVLITGGGNDAGGEGDANQLRLPVDRDVEQARAPVHDDRRSQF